VKKTLAPYRSDTASPDGHCEGRPPMRTISFIHARTPLLNVPLEFLRTGARVLVVLADDLSPIGALTPRRFIEIKRSLAEDELLERTAGDVVRIDEPDEPLPRVLVAPRDQHYFLARAASTSRSTADESPVV